MKKFNFISLIIIITFLLTFPLNAFAKEGNNNNANKPRLSKTAIDPAQSVIDINNITTWVSQEGFHDWVVGGSWNGAFPNGVNAGAIFAEGIVWGGQVHDGVAPSVRVNGNTYGTGCSPIIRLYRVRPDYLTGNLTQDAADFFNEALGQVTSSDIQALRDQYAKDWNEWPADKGAPYEDVNGNGQYDPTVDIPGIPGASQTIFIMYNDDISATNYGSIPIGLEVSETYWAYSYTGALGNVIYKKVDMVYKGTPTSAANSRIDSMYIVQWADPDVGNSTDDFAGCDTSLNLGYSYSSGATDAVYQGLGLAPPAAGYDFLQGVSEHTGNPNDSAIFNLKWRKGYKYINPKPMSSFAYFAAGGTWSDPDFTYTGSLQFYNLMRGNLPRPPYPAADPFPTTVADVTPYGTYLLDGDPVAGTGKIDGNVDGPGDRRIMVTNGPITLNLGDTAEVVVALVGGLGNSNLNSISVMKENDITAQKVYDLLFQLPSIKPPDVQIASLDKKIVLNWGSNLVNQNQIENFSGQGYDFQGYEVYQLPSPSSSITDGVKLATYDIIDSVGAVYDTVKDANGHDLPVLTADGKNTGLSRYIAVNTDPFRHTALRDGQEYYFAVVSYAYNPHPLLPFHILRSSFVIRTAIPQTTAPGVRYGGVALDTIKSVHTTGNADGSVFALIVDPAKTTGDTYKVTFDTSGGSTSWSLTDVTKSTLLISNQTNQSGNNDYPIFDGLLVKVTSPPLLGKSYSYESADPPNLSPVALQDDPSYTGGRWFTGGSHGGELFFGGVFLEPNFWGETSVSPADYETVTLKFRPMASYTDLNGNGKYDIGEPYFVDDTTKIQKAFMYQTFSGTAYEGFFNLPFTAWDVDDPANPRQLNVVVRDRDQNHQWDLNNLTDPPDTLLPNNGDQQYNYMWILNTTYDPSGTMYGDGTGGTKDFWSYDNGNGIWDAMWAIWVDDRGNGGMLAEQCSFTLVPNLVNTLNDVFTFTAPKVTSDANTAKTDVNKINVFPNPYYGYQYRETSRDDHYVTFNHLPANAVIRIFDLSGVLVKTINHVPSSGQFDTWNLQNDAGYPVASGIYVVYIDMPGLGTTKILKLAIVQEQQILKVY